MADDSKISDLEAAFRDADVGTGGSGAGATGGISFSVGGASTTPTARGGGGAKYKLGQALYDAAGEGDLAEVTRLVVERGAPVGWSSRSKATALHAAVCAGAAPPGAAPPADAPEGAADGALPCVVLLLRCGARHTPDESGRQPLHMAAALGRARCLLALAAAGAPLAQEAVDGRTAAAVSWESSEAGAKAAGDVLERLGHALRRDATDSDDEDGKSAAEPAQAVYDAAAAGGAERLGRALARAGGSGDVAAFTSDGGDNALHAAVSAGAAECLVALVREPAFVARLDDNNSAGDTPLVAAARAGDLDCAAVLVVAGADVAATDASGAAAEQLVKAARGDGSREAREMGGLVEAATAPLPRRRGRK